MKLESITKEQLELNRVFVTAEKNGVKYEMVSPCFEGHHRSHGACQMFMAEKDGKVSKVVAYLYRFHSIISK